MEQPELPVQKPLSFAPHGDSRSDSFGNCSAFSSARPVSSSMGCEASSFYNSRSFRDVL
jgi:hypothetical protein